jgi:hypothetical protein
VTAVQQAPKKKWARFDAAKVFPIAVEMKIANARVFCSGFVRSELHCGTSLTRVRRVA